MLPGDVSPESSQRLDLSQRYLFFKEIRSWGFPDFLGDSVALERNLRDKGHLGGEIQNTPFPDHTYPPPGSNL